MGALGATCRAACCSGCATALVASAAVLMTPLLVGSMMNVLWIAPLASLVLSEKLTSIGWPIARFAGKAFIVAGARLSFRGMP
jgi:predicted metal-binding membrane protein